MFCLYCEIGDIFVFLLFLMIRVHNLLTPIEDNNLDETVSQILQQHPMSGYKMMVGHLNAQGIRIQSKELYSLPINLFGGYFMLGFGQLADLLTM